MPLPSIVHNEARLEAEGTERGLPWCVTINRLGIRCGYVRVPPEHPYHGLEYDEIPDRIDVHGALTFSAADEPCEGEAGGGHWWLGFDCGHAFDAPEPLAAHRPNQWSAREEVGLLWFAASLERREGHVTVRTVDYVTEQCRALCAQLANVAGGGGGAEGDGEKTARHARAPEQPTTDATCGAPRARDADLEATRKR